MICRHILKLWEWTKSKLTIPTQVVIMNVKPLLYKEKYDCIFFSINCFSSIVNVAFYFSCGKVFNTLRPCLICREKEVIMDTLFIFSFILCFDNLCGDRNKIKNDYKIEEISRQSRISIYLYEVFWFLIIFKSTFQYIYIYIYIYIYNKIWIIIINIVFKNCFSWTTSKQWLWIYFFLNYF